MGSKKSLVSGWDQWGPKKASKVVSLCNYEVLALLNELKGSTKNNLMKSGSQLATIVYEASQYLHNLNIGETEGSVRELLKALSEFEVPFSHNEKLMLVNTLPRTSLELSLLINNYDYRLTEEQIQELLEIINKTSPLPS